MKPPAFIHIDLDGIWAVRKCYGLPEEDFFQDDPVFSEGIPQVLEIFKKKGITAGFFAVGKDLEVPEKANILARAVQSGHEIGNHSYDHTIGITRLTTEQINTNILKSKKAFDYIFSQHNLPGSEKPAGFRSPGYDADERLWNIIHKEGFSYDSSIFPTPWGFLMRFMESWVTKSPPWKKRQYGKISWGRKSLMPYRMKRHGNLVEIPVSVSPGLRLPFHFSIVQLRGFDYFRRCVDGYLDKRLPLLYLFHGVDFLETRNLDLMPGKRGDKFFKTPLKKKLKLADRILDYIDSNFNIMRARDWVRSIK